MLEVAMVADELQVQAKWKRGRETDSNGDQVAGGDAQGPGEQHQKDEWSKCKQC